LIYSLSLHDALPIYRHPFLRTYIERFYAALGAGLRSETCLPTILRNSTELFATNLDGVRMMVPDFVVGIKMVLPKLAPTFKLKIDRKSTRLNSSHVK